ncbi:MAG: hypothetical protein GWN72_24855 [Nitrospinaceae bacterium]|nr:hypothetical protein [Nitrospinaceae bacterium]
MFRPAPDGWTRYPVHPYHNFNIPGEKPWESEADIFWQLIFSIYPLDRGGYGVAESFWLQEAVSHFDGVQSFVLVSPDRPAESP